MEAEVPKLGSSLQVPSVKELLKQTMTKVPAQYVHPNQDPDVVSYRTSSPEIPVIDLSKLLSEDAIELENLDHACKEWGFFQILTNGIYQSVEHRATINSVKERISVATFHRPGLNRVIGPVPSLVTPERSAVFRRIGVADYYKGYFSRTLPGKSFIDLLKIEDEVGNHKSA
ncbi:unnamed protein product [Lupinus luteus]|uniref:Non-haem dioxygenase N-terminal domain-containing protein n=1 Tax=Lupinus luteus TaxID=3873 RepID=A0AAV1WGM3_LUPLU